MLTCQHRTNLREYSNNVLISYSGLTLSRLRDHPAMAEKHVIGHVIDPRHAFATSICSSSTFVLSSSLSRQLDGERRRRFLKVSPSTNVRPTSFTRCRAIELSLRNNRRTPELIDLTALEDDDDEIRFQEDMKRALEASQASCTSQQPALPSEASNANTSSTQSVFLSERAKLERERLERQKRLRPDTFITGETLDNSEDEDQPPSKKHHSSESLSSSFAGPSGTSVQSSTSTTDRLFLDGELRQTAIKHAEPRKDGLPTFRLTEVLGKVILQVVLRTPPLILRSFQTSDLALAILSSYALDYSWIYSFFDPSVPVIMVAQPDASGEATVKIVLPNWIRTTPFLRAGYGCQHMKVSQSDCC